MGKRIEEVVDYILSTNAERLRFGRKVLEENWKETTTRLVQIRNGAFMAQDEVEFFLEISSRIPSDDNIEDIWASWNERESHSHTDGLSV